MKKLLIVLLVSSIFLNADTNSSSISPIFYNQKQEASVENNFIETQYFQTSNPSVAVGSLILYGLIHTDKILEKEKKPLKTDFEDHKKFD